MMARVDPATYTPMPHEPGVARFAADLYVDDRPHPVLPAREPEARARPRRRAGLLFQVGIEPEFFLVVKEPTARSAAGTPTAPTTSPSPATTSRASPGRSDFLRSLSEGLDRLGWGVYQCDHEDANYQYEVNFRYADALETADRLIFFRMMAGQLARRAGAIATFMAKPFVDPHRLRRPHALSSGRCLQRVEPLPSTSPIRAGWASRSWPITSSAACWNTPGRSAR